MLTNEQYELMNHYLASLYDVSLYEKHGVAHPIVFYTPQPEQVDDIESVLGHLSKDKLGTAAMAFYHYAYLHSLQNENRHLFNGTTFVLKRLRRNPLRIDAAIGSYFDMIATCAALEQELLEIMATGGLRLLLRSQYHRAVNAQTALSYGNERSAAIGVVMLLVFNDQGQYKALISHRTARHATRPGALHLLPAFILQPMGETVQVHEWSIKHHLYREYLEELFGMAEGDSGMYSHPALLDLQQMEAEDRAQMRLTGITMNLLTLRPEISAVLVIHDKNWWQRVQSGIAGYRLNTPEAYAELMLAPIDDDNRLLSVLPKDYYLTMVPQAISALWEGVVAARKFIK